MNARIAKGEAMKIKIYGASDDLIEIAGDITEEFNFYPNDENDRRLLAFSDGTLLSVLYDRDGIWRLSVVAQGSCSIEKEEGSAVYDSPDVVMLTGQIDWVVLGKELVTAKRQ